MPIYVCMGWSGRVRWMGLVSVLWALISKEQWSALHTMTTIPQHSSMRMSQCPKKSLPSSGQPM